MSDTAKIVLEMLVSHSYTRRKTVPFLWKEMHWKVTLLQSSHISVLRRKHFHHLLT